MKFRLSLFFLLLYGFYSFGFAQQTNEQAKPIIIAGISVEGNEFVSSETIISLSGLRVGDVITSANETKIQNALLNLWKRKQFHKIDIVIDKITEAGVFLLIKF
jgi:outer membrane protein assembly factor BamA